VSTLLVKAQTSHKVVEVRYEVYENKQWVVKNKKSVFSIYVNIDGSNINITNEEQSTFKTYGRKNVTTYPTHKSYFWSAYDKNGKYVTVMIKTSVDGENILEVATLYPGYCFAYEIDEK
jgi:hypothetical protein